MNKISKKNSINKGFLAFGVFALVAIALPSLAMADAQYSFRAPRIYGQESYSYSQPAVNPTPYIYSITPDSTTQASKTVMVTVNGSGFIPGSLAKWDGIPRKTGFIDTGHLIVELERSDTNDSGRHYITIENTGPGGGFSNPVPFTVNKPAVVVSRTTTTYMNTNTDNNLSANALGAYNSMSDQGDQYGDSKEGYGDLTANAVFGSNSFFPTGIVQWLIFIVLVLAIVFIWRKFFGSEAEYHSTPLKHA